MLARAFLPMLFGALVLAIWEIGVRWSGIPRYILPAPSLIAITLVHDWPILGPSLLYTLRIELGALVAAVAGGGLLALLFALSPLIERCLLPYAIILQVTPVVAIAPLIIIWVNSTAAALLICAWVVAFFPILANLTTGLNSADRNLDALFTLYGASRLQRLRYLRLPTALPYFLTGLRTSGGLALIGAVVAEYVAGSGGRESGLAYRVVEASYRLNIARMFAALLLISANGIIIYAILSVISRWLLRNWHESALDRHD